MSTDPLTPRPREKRTADKEVHPVTMTTEAEPVAETTVDPTCGACGALLRDMAEFHPHSFCVLVKAGYDPLSVVLEAIDYLNENAKGWAKVTDVKPDGG